MSGNRLNEISLKRSAGLTAAVLSILLLTSCGTVVESSGVYSESEETVNTKQTSESADTIVRADSQLELILGKYDDLYSDFLTDDSILPATVQEIFTTWPNPASWYMTATKKIMSITI